jgi:hypothetical protein
MRSALILALVLSLTATAARASVVVPLALDELVDASEHVALVRVEYQAARWSTDHSVIYTDVTLRVLSPMKGGAAAGSLLTVRREGGVVGNIGLRVHGAAGFTEGEEAVVFLERRGAALWTVGMAQGKMRVTTVGGARVATRSTPGLAYARAPAVAEPPVLTLDELAARVAARAAVSR